MSYQTHNDKCILKSTDVKYKCIVCPQKLRCSWCRLLDHYRWTYFVTLTFRDLPKTYTAINRAKQFLRYVDKVTKEKIAYFIAMEFTQAGTPHFHALIGNVSGLKYEKWFTWWFTKYGGCRFKVYDPKKGATHYLTKYVLKDSYQRGWFDLKGLELMDQQALDK